MPFYNNDFAGLYNIIQTKTILVSLIISAFLSYLPYPLVWRLERRGINHGIAILLVMAALIIILEGITYLLFARALLMNFEFSKLKNQVLEILHNFDETVGKLLGIRIKNLETYTGKISDDFMSFVSNPAENLFTATSTIILLTKSTCGAIKPRII